MRQPKDAVGSPWSRARRFVAGALVAIVVAGCGGAYAAAIARGDKFAGAGLWDRAAAEYEAAIRIDPNDPDAQIKLKQVRKKQSAERLARGKSLMARGELVAGLAAIQDAARLDPESAEAQRALADANAQALQKAEELLAADDGRKAFELTSLVLKSSPNDPRAKDLDGRVRDRLAEQSYDRADAFQKHGKPGNALMELAACVTYRAGYRDAKLRIGQVKLALQQELMYFVVLDKFADTTGPKDLASSLSVELMSQSFDERLPLRVVKDAPGKPGDARGVRVTGKFDGYKFAHDSNKVSRSCDYVCGTEERANPAYDQADRAQSDAELALSRAEQEVARLEKEADQKRGELDKERAEMDKQSQQVDRARADLDRCMANKRPDDSSPCSSERNHLESEQSRLESLRSHVANMGGSQDSLNMARDRRETARRDKEMATQRKKDTPRTIQVDKHCPFTYEVAVHTVAARVTVELTAENLQDAKVKVLDHEPFEYKVAEQDETFEPQRNRCAEVANGDPLVISNEKQVKQKLVTQAIGGVRDKVMATYERYRQGFLADARREEAAGLTDEAVEAYVRYLLTGLKSIDPKDEKQIGEFLSKTRGFGKLDALGGL